MLCIMNNIALLDSNTYVSLINYLENESSLYLTIPYKNKMKSTISSDQFYSFVATESLEVVRLSLTYHVKCTVYGEGVGVLS